MDYVVGSIAALISGNVTPNRPKLIRRALTPTKHPASPNVTPKSEFADDRSIFLSPTQQKKKAIVKKSPKRIFENPDLDVTENSESSSPKADKVKKHLKDELEAEEMGKSRVLSNKSPSNKLDESIQPVTPNKKSKINDSQVSNENTPKKKKRKSEAEVSIISKVEEMDVDQPATIVGTKDSKSPKKKERCKSVIDVDNTKEKEADVVKEAANKPDQAINETGNQDSKKKKKKNRNKKNKQANLAKTNIVDHINGNKENKLTTEEKANENNTETKSPKKKKNRKKNKKAKTQSETQYTKEVEKDEVSQAKDEDSTDKPEEITQDESDEVDKEDENDDVDKEDENDEVDEEDDSDEEISNIANPNAITENDTDSEHDSDNEIESENEEINEEVLKNDDADDSSDDEANVKTKKGAKKTKKQSAKKTEDKQDNQEDKNPEKEVNTEEEIKRTLFVGNVPFSSKCKKEIKKIFAQYGDIETVRIRTVPVKDARDTPKLAVIKNEIHPDRSTVNVYVKFADPDSVERALAENNTVLNHHHLRVSRSGSTGVEHNPECAVFLGNLPFGIEDETLRAKFEGCGQIESVRIVRDKKTNAGKGFGYVNFASRDGVELALRLSEEDLTVKNRIIRVKRCTRTQFKGPKGPKTGNKSMRPGPKQDFGNNQESNRNFGNNQGQNRSFGNNQKTFGNNQDRNQGGNRNFGNRQGPNRNFGNNQGPNRNFGNNQGSNRNFGNNQGPNRNFGNNQGQNRNFGSNQGPRNFGNNQNRFGSQGNDASGASRRLMNKRPHQESGDGPPTKKQNVNQPPREKKPKKEFVGMTAEKKKKHKFDKGQKKKKAISEIMTK